MRCYSIQNLSFINHCIKLFNLGADTINYDNVESIDNFIFNHSRTRPIYNNNDFIFTFVSGRYQSEDWRSNLISDIGNLNTHYKYFFGDNLNCQKFCLVELDIPEEDIPQGLFGKIEPCKLVSYFEILNSANIYEYVAPELKKSWIVDFYTIKELSNIPIRNGAEIIPMNYTDNKNKLFSDNVPWVWNTYSNSRGRRVSVADKNTLKEYQDRFEHTIYKY